MPGVIHLPRRFYRQPQYPAQINRGHPYAPTLGLWLPGSGVIHNLVSGVLSSTNAASIVSDTRGRKLSFDGTNNFVNTGIRDVPAAISFIVICSGDAVPSAANNASMFHSEPYGINWNHTNAAYRGGVTLNVGATYPNVLYGTLNAGQTYHLGMSWDGATLKAFKDGVLIGSVAAAGSLTSDPNAIMFGQNSASVKLACKVELAYLTARALPDKAFKELYDNVYQLLQAPPRKIWVASITSITSDLGLQWNTLNAVTSDSSLQWNTLSAITSDLDVRWNVLNSINSDITLQWNVLNSVTSDSLLQWNTLNQILSDVDVRWNTLNSITSDMTLQWDVQSSLTSITSDLGLQWNITSSIVSDLDMRWNTLNSITSDSSLQWNILNAILSDLGLQWHLLNAINSDIQAQWNVLGAVTSDMSIRWNVISAIQSDLVLQWTVNSDITTPTVGVAPITGYVSVNTITGFVGVIKIQ